MAELTTKNADEERLRQKAELVNRHFGSISKGFHEMHQMDVAAVRDFTDQIFDTLDALWKDPDIDPAYSEKRMAHFFKLVSNALGARIEKEFTDVNIWGSAFNDVRMKLNECIRICNGWKDKIADLTGTYWKSDSHIWKGKVFKDGFLESLVGRIQEIFELRSQHDELLRILNPEDQTRLGFSTAFDPF